MTPMTPDPENAPPRCKRCGKTEDQHHYGKRYCYGTADSDSGNDTFTAPTDPTPAAPKCGYCGQPATTSNGNCTEHWGRPPAGEWVEPDARKRAEAWRVGSKVPINVYEGDRPVCQCHNSE